MSNVFWPPTYVTITIPSYVFGAWIALGAAGLSLLVTVWAYAAWIVLQ